MSKPDSSKPSKSTSGTGANGIAGAEAGEWAKAVVDGMPEAATPSDPPPAAPLGDVTPDAGVIPDEVLDAVDAAAEAEAEMAEAAAEADDLVVETDSDVDDAEADEPAAEDADRPAAQNDGEPISVEDLVIDLERVTTERDQYLDASRRLQAEFENYKKQVSKRESQARERANDSLIADLLPVMDAFDGAVANGAEDVAPMRSSFLDALEKQGLERIDPGEDPFDPNLHEAVMHEDDAETEGPVVAEVMRAGYVWKGRVLRPAMVRTRG